MAVLTVAERPVERVDVDLLRGVGVIVEDQGRRGR